MYTGELISLAVAVMWTATAVFAEVASKRMGTLPVNVVRMILSMLFLAMVLLFVTGTPLPTGTDGETWFWLSMSGLVGYVMADYCLFKSYILIGSRYGQLFMTLAAPAAAFSAWVLMGEVMKPMHLLALVITVVGIAISILGKKDNGRLALKIPLAGVLCGLGAGAGQGVGLVLSKIGIQHYAVLIEGNEALVSVMPFAATMMRAVTGLIGFSVALFLFSHDGKERFYTAVKDRKGMSFALLATIFGPFVGVSLSLLATLYTSAGTAQTLMSLTPILIIVPTWLFFNQKIRMVEVLGAVISILGASLFFM